MSTPSLGPDAATACWIRSPLHQDYLANNALKQLDFFRPSLQQKPGFHVLAQDGGTLDSTVQELHTTTRMIHSFALGKIAGVENCDAMIDQGMRYLFSHHRDREHGGFVWALDDDGIHDDRKLAYGHVFALLAGSSALAAGHPDGAKLITQVDAVLDRHFWQDEPMLFCDEWNRDWTPFSKYRGMNANMHGTEALLATYEATGREKYLDRAGRILDFFLGKIAPSENWRLPEHYTENWAIDRSYSGNPMFRPAGTTPGHSFELARLLLQYWDLRGRPDDGALQTARKLTYRALGDAWDGQSGGLVYTLNFDGSQAITDRYWWPVTEAIGVLAALLKCDPQPSDEDWYRKLWLFADQHFIDYAIGGWFPEIDAQGRPTEVQFLGKPDIYHSLQATLFPLTNGISNAYKGLEARLRP
ncbi:AGE family epimerase/isomerase [Parasedimentitalea psychrophila]|uniref:AGE family epimerase/isomerase n=1 Tax=Parasedimentitalea psychrophila TaxID=2997337 RepID=A0A9Y2L2J5_9RHOB|nr:AGE family epimerase/isomerase [Parasedimentitalea psychrophila]WIY26963.1 AGE family epimerase/isomerase [Parasedimentitalea psychrophila]